MVVILLNLKFKTKIIAIFSLVILLVTVSFIVFLRQNIFSQIRDETTKNHLQLCLKILENVDAHIETIDNISKKLISNKNLLDTLERINALSGPLTNQEKLVLDRELSDITFDAVSLTSFPVFNVYIFSKDLDYMFVYNQNASNLMLALQDPITTQQLYQRQMIIFPLYEPGRGVGESNFISYVRLILDVDAKKYGYVEIQENDGEFKKMVDIENAGEVFIMYANQQIVYSANPIDASVREAISRIGTDQTSGMFKDNKGNIYFYAASEYSGLSVYLKYDPTVLYSSLSFLEKATYLVAGIITVASFLLIFLFSHWLVAPLRDLRDSILRVNYKNMGLQIQPTNNNEIKMLKEAFQSILDQLKLSIENEIASNKAETKARMAALQAQIAPHFIHNVLYAISIAAEEHRTHDVRSMCEQLSEMMRYTVKSGTVRLEEEMNYIVNYLSLQAKKYEDFLIFEVKMDEQTKELQFPRLSIQPFVENAIKYAFNDRRPPYRISVISELKEGRWRIDIIDNGTGMDRATIEAVYRKLEKGELIYDHLQSDMRPATDLNGMGIVNSALRLKMFYGESFKFSIDNHREGGTVVSLEGSGRPSA